MTPSTLPSPPPPRRRLPLAARKRAERRAARARIAARTVHPLPLEVRPVSLPRPLPVARLLRASSSLLASLGLHGALVGVAFAAGVETAPPRPEPLTVEMRERPTPPPPPAPKAEPAPEPQAIATPEPPRETPRRRPPPPPKAPPPPPATPTAAPPPRIVGLNLESTTESGSGPAFAVGNTRSGETDTRAADPKRVPPVGTAPGPVSDAPVSLNRRAENLPSKGVSYTMPRRRRPSTPPYPETLKSQGIEADVTVLVRLDASGAVLAVEIVRGSGHPELDAAARTAAQGESFVPARRDGAAIPYSLSFTYRFRLESP